MLIAAGMALAATALTAAPDLEGTRTTFKEWVGVQKMISQEKNDWKVAKETLQESIELLQQEIEDLEAKIKSFDEQASQSDKARLELKDEETKLKEATSVVQEAIGDIEAQVLDLVDYFPDSLKKKVTPITARIPRTEKDAKGTVLSSRIVNVVGLLNEVDKFNTGVWVEETMQEIGGEQIQVKTLYVGLAVAYYVDGTNSVAGYLTPAKKGWTKTDDNSLALPISNAIKMAEKELQPDFVNLPFSVTDVK